jgi:hypothetical protein
MMSGLMQQFSNFGGGGVLNKIPGFKQLGAMNQMKNMDIGSLLGDLMGGGEGGMPNIPGMPGMGGVKLPPGYTPPGGASRSSSKGTKSRAISRSQKKRKRRAVRKARKGSKK